MPLRPTYRFFRVTDISVRFLREHGIRGLLLDVDNTLAGDQEQALLPGLTQWIETSRAAGVALTVVSNAAKRRLAPFAEKIGLDYVSRAAKPLGFGYLTGLRRLGLPKKEAAVVGDQLFTDILGANLLGIRSILVEPVAPEHGASFAVRRKLEKKILGKERGSL